MTDLSAAVDGDAQPHAIAAMMAQAVTQWRWAGRRLMA
jgi:hypothetical protein